MSAPRHRGERRGFARASELVATRIRVAGEARGFAVSRLLTHWEEVVGETLARLAQPVSVTYGRGGMGATLTLLVPGAEAPRVEMERERIRERVNACYGYRAIARVRITQTAATGFAEAQAAFGGKPHGAGAVTQPDAAATAGPGPALANRAAAAVTGVEDTQLRLALAALAANVLARNS